MTCPDKNCLHNIGGACKQHYGPECTRRMAYERHKAEEKKILEKRKSIGQ